MFLTAWVQAELPRQVYLYIFICEHNIDFVRSNLYLPRSGCYEELRKMYTVLHRVVKKNIISDVASIKAAIESKEGAQLQKEAKFTQAITVFPERFSENQRAPVLRYVRQLCDEFYQDIAASTVVNGIYAV